MFYSHDILGRKTPLGAIWTLAHGKKLSKGKIIKIHLPAIIKEILQPSVPHSLRLQAIMINGVVRVYERQTLYLLEELQGLVQQVSFMAMQGTDTSERPTKGGGGSGKPANLAKAKQSAKLEAITLPRAGVVVFEDLDEGLEEGAGPHVLPELADDLFVLSLGDATPAASGATSVDAPPRERSAAPAVQLMPGFTLGGVPVATHVDAPAMEWVQQDDVFDVPWEPLHEALLGPAPSQHLSEAEGQLSPAHEDKQPVLLLRNSSHDEAAGGALAAGEGQPLAALPGTSGSGNVQRPLAPPLTSEDTALSDSNLAGEDLDPTPAAAAAAMRSAAAKRTAGLKRKGEQAVVLDPLDALLIRGNVYREWTTSHEEVLTSPRMRRQRRRRAAASSAGAEALLTGQPACVRGGGGCRGGAWCYDLLQMYKKAAQPPEPAAVADAADGHGRQLAGRCGGADAAAGAVPMDDDAVPVGEQADEGLQGLLVGGMAPLEEEHDLLGDLPFNDDLEAERLRAAATPSDTGAGRVHLLTRRSSGTTPATGRRTTTTASGSTLMPHSERSMPMGRQGSVDLEGMLRDVESPLRFGSGALEDLLPDVGGRAAAGAALAPQPLAPAALAGLGSLAGSGGIGSGRGGGALGASIPSSQFPLLVESATQGWGAPSQLEALSAQTALVISVFRSRLLLQAAAEDEGDDDSAGATGASPRLSLFSLAQQLSRSDAAKLFYQVCVISTSFHINAEQAEPYGDITIRPGRLL